MSKHDLMFRPLAMLLAVVLAVTCLPVPSSAAVPSIFSVTGGSSDPTAITYDANGNLLTKMATQETLTLGYDAENRLVNAQRQSTAPQSVSVTLNPGWNWFALPVDPANDSITSVLSAISGSYSQVSRYNATTDSFEHYVGNATFDQFTSFEPGRGYQVYCTAASPVSVVVTGPPVAVAVPLATSSNLIGVASSTQATVSALLAGLQLSTDYDTVWKHNGSAFVTLAPTDTVQPGTSVYLHMLQPDSWTPPTPTAITAMTYDGDGGRVQTTVNGQATTFLGQLVDVTGGVLTKHLYFGGQRIGSITSGTPTYVHGDHLGSTSVQTGGSGTQTGGYSYTPFGSLVSANPQPTGSPQLYTGQRLDTGSGLYYYNARYYDQDLGRFISPDSIVQAPADPQTLNRYAYCRNNPINNVDPSGHLFGLIAAIVAAVAWDYGVRLVKQKFNPSDAWDEYTRDLTRTWAAVRAPLISGVSAWALTGLVFGFGMGAAVAGVSAAATTAVLQTGEGRQFVQRAGNEFFDDALGMRPQAAHRAAALTTHMVVNAGFQAYRRTSGSVSDDRCGEEV